MATITGAASTQINFLVPAGPLPNPAMVEVTHAGTIVATGSVPMTALSPGIFTRINSGSGIFNGQSYDQNRYDTVYLPGSPVTPVPVSPNSGSGPNTLVLYGTGWANAGSSAGIQTSIRASVGGVSVTPDYVGPSSLAGLDQINLKIPFGLSGASNALVSIAISFGNYSANTVQFCLAGQNASSVCPTPNSTPSPLCNQPLPGIAAPYAPHGIFELEFPGQSVTPSVQTAIQNAPTVCGGNIFVVWSQIDSGNGQYNWSPVDTLMAPWIAAGKSVNLIVWGVSDSSSNDATPAYVLSDPAYQSVSCANEGTPTLYSYPVYYSPGYKNNYKTFIQAVLNRYAGNPGVGYIRFGISRGGEAFPTCLTQMMALGGYSTIAQFDAEWESYITEMTDFQQTTLNAIALSSGRVVQLMAALNQYGTPVQYNVTSFEAQNAVSLGFGFGSQGLQLSDIANYNSGQPCSSDWCANFVLWAGEAPLELQTIAAVIRLMPSGAPAPWPRYCPSRSASTPRFSKSMFRIWKSPAIRPIPATRCTDRPIGRPTKIPQLFWAAVEKRRANREPAVTSVPFIIVTESCVFPVSSSPFCVPAEVSSRCSPRPITKSRYMAPTPWSPESRWWNCTATSPLPVPEP